MTPTSIAPVASRRGRMPRWVWRGLLVVAIVQCVAVLSATLARALGLIADPAALPDAIVAATAICVSLIAVLLYRHHTALAGEDALLTSDVASAHMVADIAPLTPMAWQPIPHLALEAQPTSDLPGSPMAPPSLPLDVLRSA